MNSRATDGAAPSWLAAVVLELLEEKYGRGRIPGARRISADIAKANDGETISHGHVRNILNSEAQNLTDRTRGVLARFFGKHPSYFYPPREPRGIDADSVQALAARFATFNPAQVEAIKQAIEIVTTNSESEGRFV
jgi:hypothetical protein